MNTSERHPLAAALPDLNHGAGSLTRTMVEFPGPAPDWCAEALQLAIDSARTSGAAQVVAIGCDQAVSAPGIRLIAVREGGAPAGLVSDVEWVDCGLTHGSDVDELPRILPPLQGSSVVVVLGLFERQQDPRRLVRALKNLLLDGNEHRLFVAATDRTRRGTGETGNWPHPAHFREWSFDELPRFLEANGFCVKQMRRIGQDGALAEISFSRSGYDAFLAQHGLPHSSLRQLIISTEHGRCRTSGGIGSYVEEHLACAEGRVGLMLLTSEANLPPADVVHAERWLTPGKFGFPSTDPRLSDATLKFLQHAVSYYPQLEAVEYQDYQGIGARLVQARPAGLLPRDLRLEVCCHGSHVYIENSFEQWMQASALQVLLEERISIEQADRIIFPTRFLAAQYADAGYHLDRARCEVRRLPFLGFSANPEDLEVAAADTLIFFGKRTRMKGFPAFVAALRKLLELPSPASRLKRVVLLGPKDDSLQEENAFIDSLKDRIEVVELSVPRPDALRTLRTHAPTAVCVTPYIADNHPVSVLEVVASGCQLVAADRGGIPELIPESFHEDVLADPHSDELVDLLAAALEMDSTTRRERVHGLYRAMRAEQDRINALFAAPPSSPRAEPSRPRARPAPGRITVIVPCFNTDLHYVRELVSGLNQQTLAPAKIIFVDDGSHPDYAPNLQKTIESTCRFPFEIIRHAVNRGLAAARNTALKRVTTEYLVNIDSDDVPKNDFLRCYVEALDADPDAAAATSYADHFPDGNNWSLVKETEPEAYRPYGAGVVLSHFENCLGHANSAFRASRLRDVGGWDQTDNSKWEDYGLLLTLVSSGHRVVVVPRATWLYRCRPNSMVRTYPQFPAERRLARALRGIDRFEALRLRAVLTREIAEYRALQAKYDALEAEFRRFRYRSVRNLLELIEQQPQLFEALRGAHHRLTLLWESYQGRPLRGVRGLAENTLSAARRLVTNGRRK